MANKKTKPNIEEQKPTFDYADENGNVIEEKTQDQSQSKPKNNGGGCKHGCGCHGQEEHHECHHEHGQGCCCHHEHEIKETNLDYLELAQRLKAEFDNYKRRNADARAEAYNDGIIDVVKQLLPVLDGFHQATKNISDPSTLEGVSILQKQLLDALSTFGVSKIDCVGKLFDPHSHNAVVAVEVEGVEPDMVVEEYQEGFKLKDKVIRHSVVRISK